MTEAILSAVAEAVSDRGVTSRRAYAETPLDRESGPVLCVGLRENRLLQSGWGDYLGKRQDVLLGEVSVYGYRCEPVLSLDVYSPDDGERGFAACLDTASAVQSALGSLPSGLRVRSLLWESPGFDAQSGMFLMRGSLSCAALFTREEDAQSGVFTNFALKGVLTA